LKLIFDTVSDKISGHFLVHLGWIIGGKRSNPRFTDSSLASDKTLAKRYHFLQTQMNAENGVEEICNKIFGSERKWYTRVVLALTQKQRLNDE
jgi:hypothetical protein